MSAKRPRLAPAAQADLMEIWDYIAERDPRAADRMVDSIPDRAGHHANFPRTGRPRDDIRQGLRSSAVAPYVILFHEVDDTIEVLRVVHGSRDIDAIMGDAS